MSRRESRRETVLRVDGVFDVPAARQVEQALARARPGDAVRLDLTKVEEFHDFGVAVLAQALKQVAIGGPRVALHGLRRHQLRLLRYFGAEPDRFGPAAPQPDLP